MSVVALFILPFVIASWFYKQTVKTEVWGTSNKGLLVRPVRALSDFTLFDQTGEQYNAKRFLGHWTLVFISPEYCDEPCKKNIYHMRQIWISLGKDANRLQRLLVFTTIEQKQQLMDFLKAYPQTLLVVDENEQLVGQIETARSSDEPAIMLIDPLGYIMMSFPQAMDPQDILKDLRKLLKISQIG